MSTSPRLPKKTSQTTKKSRSAPLSAPLLLVVTALDTTWRIFVPILGGLFLGIGIDSWLGWAPAAMLTGLIVGIIITTLLIIRQLNEVRKTIH